MRRALILAAAVALFSGTAATLAAGKKDDGGQQANSRAVMADELARKIFSSADHNRNQMLSKREFADAETRLRSTLDEWGRKRVIGQPRKTSPRKQEKNLEAGEMATASMKVSGDKLAKSNKVTQAEFSSYVQSAVEQADQQWRQANTAADAQAKAAKANRPVRSG